MAKKHELARMSNVSLSLDGYGDIFSDFDPRHYSHRALSVDFLEETKRATRETAKGGIELKLLLDKKKRNVKDETVIKRRLRNHFNRHFGMLKKERQGIMKKGLALVFFGVLVMILTTAVMFTYGEADAYTTFLIILLEPAGWFLFWEGLNITIFEAKKSTPDLKFYERMTRCRINFISY